ncbi:MAG: bifunctional DNA primase/polymerase [Ardenticatenaceae bacterium]|nr:bifunctional DNA primase/polymerase [Ardenticatenaceae bacterium]
MMANKKALQLIELGLHPVLLGSDGDNLKRPLLKGWQTAIYTPADVARWPARNNVGIRCGWQQTEWALLVFDFDEEANRILPDWVRWAAPLVAEPLVIVTTGRGYHIYFYTEEAYPGGTLAGKYGEASPPGNGRKRLFKFIETLGTGRQVVTAGSRHPLGHRYRFRGQATYTDIPYLSAEQYQRLVAFSRGFDQRPKPAQRKKITPPKQLVHYLPPPVNCLLYARHFLGGVEQVERNGDIRILGYGGLLITADGRGWYSFSEETGGGLPELIAWHQALVGEGAC